MTDSLFVRAKLGDSWITTGPWSAPDRRCHSQLPYARRVGNGPYGRAPLSIGCARRHFPFSGVGGDVARPHPRWELQIALQRSDDRPPRPPPLLLGRSRQRQRRALQFRPELPQFSLIVTGVAWMPPSASGVGGGSFLLAVHCRGHISLGWCNGRGRGVFGGRGRS